MTTRVAVVAPRFPPDVGGLENYVGWVATALDASRDHEVVVIATNPGRSTTRETWRGIPVIRLGTWVTLSNTPVDPRWAWQLRALLREERVDVVNAHAPVPGLADLAAYRSPVPVVLTYHSGSLLKESGGAVNRLLGAYERRVLPRVFARSDELVAVSPVSTAMTMRQEGREVHLIPPGVDGRLFTPPAQPREDHPPRLLYVGRVERTSRWKGIEVLVRALALLAARNSEAVLDVVGAGDDVPRLQALAAESGIAERIVWHGARPHEELPDFYRRATVTVLPSLTESESFGMTLIEAMACGCPVVGSSVGGIPFVVRDGVDGLLVPPGDVDALAAALAGLLADPAQRAALGDAGRQAVQDRWDWSRQRDRTLAVLDQAAASASGGRRHQGSSNDRARPVVRRGLERPDRNPG